MSRPTEVLRSSAAYIDWTDDQIWEAVLNLMDREVPLPNFSKNLFDTKEIFDWALSKVRWEHKYVRARYYTGEGGKPLVNPLHVEHLTRLIHYYSHALWRECPDNLVLLDSLFFVMRSRFNINLFYRTEVNDFFLPRHALGTILGYGEWGRFLYLTQGCTIGQNRDEYPEIGDGFIMGPNSSVFGGCKIGRNVQLAAGAMVVSMTIPDDTVVFGQVPNVKLKPNNKCNIRENFFYDDLLEDLKNMGLSIGDVPKGQLVGEKGADNAR